MKICPKGQVVIPSRFRKSIGITPGSNVVFELKREGILIEKPAANVAEIFDKIAKSGKSKAIEPHDAYEEELEYRWKKLKTKK